MTIIIPARSGSKRIPRKNLQLLDPAHPASSLLDIAIRRAINASGSPNEDIIVATDDPEAALIAHGYNVRVFHREPAGDAQQTADLVLEMKSRGAFVGSHRPRICIVEPSAPFIPAWAITYGQGTDYVPGVSSVCVTDNSLHGFRRVGMYSRPLCDFQPGGLCWGGATVMLGVNVVEGTDINTHEDLESARALWPLVKKRMCL